MVRVWLQGRDWQIHFVGEGNSLKDNNSEHWNLELEALGESIDSSLNGFE